MGHPSSPTFQTLHALRIKGFASADTLADMTSTDTAVVEVHLGAFSEAGHVQYRENRDLWQLTPDGRVVHGEQLAADLGGFDVQSVLAPRYEPFLAINSNFKVLCGDWQLRDGAPNDHSDLDYDGTVVERLEALHAEAHPLVAAIGADLDRMAPYAPRLESVLGRVRGGESKMFTGVMCGSYHDVWMELHEDLILSQGIDRNAEGSF